MGVKVSPSCNLFDGNQLGASAPEEVRHLSSSFSASGSSLLQRFIVCF